MRLIDADALIEAMEERKNIWLSKCEYNDAIREVKEAPTLPNPCGNPCAFERPHGEWIDAREHCDEFMCSGCNMMYKTNNYNFCPNCGAKMRREGESGYDYNVQNPCDTCKNVGNCEPCEKMKEGERNEID